MKCGKSIFRSTITCYKSAESLYWRLGEIPYEKHDHITRTCFLEKYGGLSLYGIDFERIYSIDTEDIHFLKRIWICLNWLPIPSIWNSSWLWIFFLHDDLFDVISETDQNSDIVLKVINKYVSLTLINDNGTDSMSKLRNWSEIVSHCHQHLREK